MSGTVAQVVDLHHEKSSNEESPNKKSPKLTAKSIENIAPGNAI